jgi:hypothetical protein
MNAWAGVPQDDGLLTGTQQKLVESAKEHLRGEQVLAVFQGQTFISPVFLPVVSALLFVFGARPRTVIVTDASVITLQESIWLQSKVSHLVSRHRRGSVPMKLTRLGLKVGDDAKIFAMIGSFQAMKQAAVVGSGAVG